MAYGDVTVDTGYGNPIRLEKAMIPGAGFIPVDQGQFLVQGVVRQLGVELFKRLREEFIAGGHNRTGATLDSMQIHMGPMSVKVSMRGGAMFVEGGFPAHQITVHDPSSALHWTDPEEGFAKQVWNPGYEGDPFIERAMDDIRLDSVLTGIAKNIFTQIGSNLRGIAANLGGTFGWQSGSESTTGEAMADPMEGQMLSQMQNEENIALND